MWNINYSYFIFLIGFITGTIISILIQNKKQFSVKDDSEHELDLKLDKISISMDLLRYGNHNYNTESEFLFNNTQILCLVIVTKNKNFQAIKNTWGKNCNAINSIQINKTKSIFPSKSNSQAKYWIQFCNRVKQTPPDYKWLLVVDDDTFVIMENLRYYLSNKNHSENLYLGHSVKFWNTHYNVAKAGYVLSRGVINSLKYSTCDNDISYRNKEDFLLGNFLKKSNISVADTKDNLGLSLFHPYNLNRLLFPIEKHKFNSVYEEKCCSRYTISFNAMDADKMYTYYYMLNTLQLFYDGNLGNRQPEKPPDEQIWQEFLSKQNISLDISNEEYYNVWDRLIDSPEIFGRNVKREDYTDSN